MLDSHSWFGLQRRAGVGDQLAQGWGVSQDVGLSVLKLGKSQANWAGLSCTKESSITKMGMVWHLSVRIRHFLNFSITSFPLSSEINIPVLLLRVLTAFKGFFLPHLLCNFDLFLCQAWEVGQFYPNLYVWHPASRFLALENKDLCLRSPEASGLPMPLFFSEASFLIWLSGLGRNHTEKGTLKSEFWLNPLIWDKVIAALPAVFPL